MMVQQQKRIIRLTLVAGLASVLIASLALGHEEHIEVANKQVTLRDVCSNYQVPIISVEEVRRLIRDLKSHPELCPNSYVQSFYELEPILVLEHHDRLCSEKKFEQIKDYHFRYINPLVETYKLGDDLNNLGSKIVKRPLDVAKVDYTVQLDDYKQEILIPISLQQFFKAWALQVSGVCKRTLMDNLDKAMQLLTDADFDIMSQVTKAGSKVQQITGKPIDQSTLNFGNLVYMPRLEGELVPGDAELRDRVTILDLRSKPELNRLMHACQRRFQPIYSKLILPIVRLNKLGYDYVGPHLDDISDKLDQDDDVKRWLMVTKICESQGNYELIESDTPNATGDSQTSTIQRLNYAPMYNYRVDGELWVKGAEALAKEFDRINGHNSRGLKKFLFHTGVAGRKLVAAIDPHQFAWYRRNQNTLSSSLNIASIMSNTVSMIAG